ncbi:MAG: urease accessory protein UreE [Cyanobacteria bacterium J06632_22]
MIVLTQRCSLADVRPDGGPGFGCNGNLPVPIVLPLTADARTRSRHRHVLSNGDPVYLQLPRGTCLQHGDLLSAEAGEVMVRIVAKPEPVMTVRASTPLALLKAAYHLGNRHVPLEVTLEWLRLAPDPVLKSLLIDQLRVNVVEEVAPFRPESGAYHSRHHASHAHSHAH